MKKQETLRYAGVTVFVLGGFTLVIGVMSMNLSVIKLSCVFLALGVLLCHTKIGGLA